MKLTSFKMAAIYRGFIRVLDRFVDAKFPSHFKTFWHHPAGPKTVFFWAPTFKWSLVIAGAADLVRPAEKLSAKQSSALAATGCIWSRYSVVIIPKNWNLFAVNIFLAAVGINQLSRIWLYQRSLEKSAKEEQTKETSST